MNAARELRKDIAQILGALGMDPERAENAAWAITASWRVERINTPTKDAHPLIEQEYGHFLRIGTEWRPETPAEVADREARHAAVAWACGDHDDPPPERVSINDLLDQDTWWRAHIQPWTEWKTRDRATEPLRLLPPDDPHDIWDGVKIMDLDHKVALLAWLRRRADALHDREARWFGGAPDDVWESWEREDPKEWLEGKPLIKALVWQTTPVAYSPLTWRPLAEVEAGALVIVRRYGLDEQIWARRIAGEWWQIIEHGWTRVPPAWIRETGCEWRLPWPEAEFASVLGVLPAQPVEICDHGQVVDPADPCPLCEDDDDEECPHGTPTSVECVLCWNEH